MLPRPSEPITISGRPERPIPHPLVMEDRRPGRSGTKMIPSVRPCESRRCRSARNSRRAGSHPRSLPPRLLSRRGCRIPINGRAGRRPTSRRKTSRPTGIWTRSSSTSSTASSSGSRPASRRTSRGSPRSSRTRRGRSGASSPRCSGWPSSARPSGGRATPRVRPRAIPREGRASATSGSSGRSAGVGWGSSTRPSRPRSGVGSPSRSSRWAPRSTPGPCSGSSSRPGWPDGWTTPGSCRYTM